MFIKKNVRVMTINNVKRAESIRFAKNFAILHLPILKEMGYYPALYHIYIDIAITK